MAAAHWYGAFGRCRFKRIQCIRQIMVTIQVQKAVGIAVIWLTVYFLPAAPSKCSRQSMFPVEGQGRRRRASQNCGNTGSQVPGAFGTGKKHFALSWWLIRLWSCGGTVITWRWRQQIPPKHCHLSTKLHGITAQTATTLNIVCVWKLNAELTSHNLERRRRTNILDLIPYQHHGD